jgi:hypothetical protein
LKKENLLTSWKEIASYIDRDVRTCHRLEKEFGLPVHRMGDTPRSRVFAYVEELDEWMAERGNNNHIGIGIESDPIPKYRIPLGWRLAVLTTIVMTSALAAYLLFFNRSSSLSSQSPISLQNANALKDSSNQHGEKSGLLADLQPSDYKIDGSVLIITNKADRELFRYDTRLDDLRNEDYYRLHFQTKSSTQGPSPYRKTPMKDLKYPHLIIEDLDKDGRREVLFAPQTKSEKDEESIICFNDRGEKLWEYRTGRHLEFGDIEYPDQYRVAKLGVEDMDGDGKAEIFLVSNHKDDFPTQFLVLGADGKKKGEYWNSGRMMDWVLQDIDDDGRKEILFAAMNNELAAPVLIIFDQDNVMGSSPQLQDFWTCPELSPGKEMYYLRFSSNFEMIFPGAMEGLLRVNVVNGQVIETETTHSGIIFYFDLGLKLKSIRLTHIFISLYNEKMAEGKVTESFDHDSITARLRKDIRYWDGENWVSTPTMTRYWRDRQ